MPRCCGTVFHREACPGATGELGSGPEGAPGHGVPEERQGGGFAREGEAGPAVYKEAEGRQQQGQDVEAQVLGRRRGCPYGWGRRQRAQGRPEGGRREPLEEDRGGEDTAGSTAWGSQPRRAWPGREELLRKTH